MSGTVLNMRLRKYPFATETEFILCRNWISYGPKALQISQSEENVQRVPDSNRRRLERYTGEPNEPKTLLYRDKNQTQIPSRSM